MELTMDRLDSGFVLDLSCKPLLKREATTPPHYYNTPEPMPHFSPDLPPTNLQYPYMMHHIQHPMQHIQHPMQHVQYSQEPLLVGSMACCSPPCSADDRLYERVPLCSPTNKLYAYQPETAMQPAQPDIRRSSVREDTSETSSNHSGSSSLSPTFYSASSKEGKATRPFKAYLKDPFTMAAGFTSADTILNDHSATRFSEFRNHMLDQIRKANGGQTTVSNPKMRRTVNRTHAGSGGDEDSLIEESKDNTYFEKRKKNNEAAKKSRDRRRIKEDEIAIRAAFLERENMKLKFKLATARKQLSLYGITIAE